MGTRGECVTLTCLFVLSVGNNVVGGYLGAGVLDTMDLATLNGNHFPPALRQYLTNRVMMH